MKKNKNEGGLVFSTNKNIDLESLHPEDEQETLPNHQQLLTLHIEKNNRGGKIVTIIKNFIGKPDELEHLGKQIKSFCGTGGSVKDGEIIIQGNFRDKIALYLQKLQFKTKNIGG
jgi:translation initiation factor 1